MQGLELEVFRLLGMAAETEILLGGLEQRKIFALMGGMTDRALPGSRRRVRMRPLGLFRHIPMALHAELLHGHDQGRALVLVRAGMTDIALTLGKWRVHGGLDQFSSRRGVRKMAGAASVLGKINLLV